MSTSRRTTVFKSARALACALALVCLPPVAFGQGAKARGGPSSASSSSSSSTPPPPSSAAPNQGGQPPIRDNERSARELFMKGNELLAAGDVEGALALFLRSRELAPSFSNTVNSALCLEKLGRYDEALELYEGLITEFSDKFEPQERVAVAEKTSELRRKVGSLDVTSNVEGLLVVDSRARGQVPRTTPLRVLPGRHTVRVIKDGYEPADVEAQVSLGGTAFVDVKLHPLTSTGRLHVETKDGERGLAVVVDQAPVGVTPWEGNLGPGPHLLQVVGKTVGSMPAMANVVTGQTASAVLATEPLGPEVTIRTDPTTARIELGDVALGAGLWVGRLPSRTLAVRAVEEGYFPASATLAPDGPRTVLLHLAVDPKHPRWPRPPRGTLFVEAIGGLGAGFSTGSGAESRCADQACSHTRIPLFLRGGARVGYALPIGLFFELGFSYGQIGVSLHRTVVDSGRTYTADDTLRTRTLTPTVGAGVRFPVARMNVSARLDAGVVIASTRDPISASIVDSSGSAPLTVDRAGASTSSTLVLLSPEVDAEWSFAPAYVLVGIAQPVLLGAGSHLPNGEGATVPIPVCAAGTSSAACARGTNAFAGEKAIGTSTYTSIVAGFGVRF